MFPMARVLTFGLLIALSVWVAVSAARIERLNAAAGTYLPGRGGDGEGKWRISLHGTPHDRLRRLVAGVGLWQYALAPMVILLAAWHVVRGTTATARWTAALCGVIGLLALALAFYRGYFSSLGR
jgi:hypothetical protein